MARSNIPRKKTGKNTAPKNAVVEAETIVRDLIDVDDIDIDWCEEPKSEIERKVRAALLRKAIDQLEWENWPPGLALIDLRSLLQESGYSPFMNPEQTASDFCEVWYKIEDAHSEFKRKERRKAIKDALREATQ